VLWVAYATHSTLKPVEQFPDINKLCNFASFWIYIGILLGAHPILHISRIRVNTQLSGKTVRDEREFLILFVKYTYWYTIFNSKSSFQS
jgi:hypothetical protein